MAEDVSGGKPSKRRKSIITIIPLSIVAFIGYLFWRKRGSY